MWFQIGTEDTIKGLIGNCNGIRNASPALSNTQFLSRINSCSHTPISLLALLHSTRHKPNFFVLFWSQFVEGGKVNCSSYPTTLRIKSWHCIGMKRIKLWCSEIIIKNPECTIHIQPTSITTIGKIDSVNYQEY